MFGSDSRTGDTNEHADDRRGESRQGPEHLEGIRLKVIRKLNEEMEEKGMLVVKGKVSADYFAERYFGKDGGSDVR